MADRRVRHRASQPMTRHETLAMHGADAIETPPEDAAPRGASGAEPRVSDTVAHDAHDPSATATASDYADEDQTVVEASSWQDDE